MTYQTMLSDSGLVPADLRQEACYGAYTLSTYYGDNEIAKAVFSSKYAAPEDYWNGEPNLYRFWERLAWGAAQAEENPNAWYPRFLELLKDWKYVFGGRINYALGREGTTTSLNNCYTSPINDDSLYGIFTCLTETARTYAKHGGVGNHLSILRPKGAPVKGSAMGAPGAVSFMDLFSTNTGTIAQDGRRGAEMLSIDDWHPDVHAFVAVKNDGWPELMNQMARFSPHLAKQFNDQFGDRRKVSFANISPHISDAFMQAVLNNADFSYRFPDITVCPAETDPVYVRQWREKYKQYLKTFDGYRDGIDLERKLDRMQEGLTIYDTRWTGDLQAWEAEGYPVQIYKTEKARVLWDKLIESAWRSAEPGILFKDSIKKDWTANIPVLTTNPCGEVTLSAYEPCCLGHHRLSAYVTADNTFDHVQFTKNVALAVRMQDNIHTANRGRQALQQQEDASWNYRRLGIGITALADLLIHLGLRYDSVEALTLVRGIMRNKHAIEYAASSDLALEKGAFPEWDLEAFQSSRTWQLLPDGIQEKIRQHGLRNVATSTVAPVGTGSLVSQSSGSGLEPIFQIKFERRVKQEDGSYKTFVIYDPLLKKLYPDGGIPDHVVDAHTVDLDKRVEMQAIIGEFTTNSISSTINLPEHATKEDVERVYLKAYDLGLKGVTIYRNGSRAGILRTLEDDGLGVGRTVAKTPDELPALRVVRRAEGKKWYFTISLKFGKPYELFIKTNSPESNANTDAAINALVTMVQERGVSSDFVNDQLKKSHHQSNAERLGRIISLCLRHDVGIDAIIDTLHDLPTYHAGSVIFHVAKILAEQVPNGTVYKGDCPGCNQTGTIRYESGCLTCHSCGYSKCG